MDPLAPLRFGPILKRAIWGGRRLATLLAKSLGPHADYAESWEICDRNAEQSVVAEGPLAGTTLGDLVRRRGQELLGRHHPLPSFPLLFKFLDANATLSVQVHPNDHQAARLTPGEPGKTEAWVVLGAEPESRLFAGLREGVGRTVLLRAIELGEVEDCLHSWRPQVGECVFVPAGTVHAIGEGLLIAEIQQPSDATFRIFDWGRVDESGKPRPTHLAQALEVADYSAGPIFPQQPKPTDRPHVERLVACDYFVLDRWTLRDRRPIGGDSRFHLISAIQGGVRIESNPGFALAHGETALLPACFGPVDLIPTDRAILLDAYLP